VTPGVTATQRQSLDGSVLILGGGVNGACVARELAINGVPVVLVDEADLASGASAKSSRLIHGGLRYLEYADFHLVRESLDERRRLLTLAPQFVRPLRLHIPIRQRLGGLMQGATRFLNLERFGPGRWLAGKLALAPARGLYAVLSGLWMYDRLAGGDSLPKSSVQRVGEPGTLPVDPGQYQWLCTYWDAQITATERFILALLRDASGAAAQLGSVFEVRTYHRARLDGDGVTIRPVEGAFVNGQAGSLSFRPAMIVNATGAWGDWTLKELPVSAPRLFGGTRGSHVITRQAGLREAIGGDAIYAEARDGRLVFILPWDDAVMVGTTDVRFDDQPDRAVAQPDEIAYLVRMVNEVFPKVELRESDVALHYSGIRPLPAVAAARTGAIPRDHDIDARTTSNDIPIETLIGGKLTTCRAFGELAADRVLDALNCKRVEHTRERFVPGAEGFPTDADEGRARIERLAAETGYPMASVEIVWSLLGTEGTTLLHELVRDSSESPPMRELLAGTDVPLAVVDWMIRHEWVTGVADLVERRLLLPFRGPVGEATLLALEQRIAAIHGSCPLGARHAAERLRRFYGVEVVP
jgi:glycerol-3-phosphate dehydrogenase